MEESKSATYVLSFVSRYGVRGIFMLEAGS